jgi:uncharacterized damage-inducible protein DinB
MQETERINDQLRRAFIGKAWHGPSVKEALDGIKAEQAAARPLENAHSIWELAHHVGAWADIVRRAVSGEKFEVTDDMNFPPVKETTEAAWQASLQRLHDIHDALTHTVSGLAESRLEEPAVEGSSTVYVLLHGVVQHHIYHAGQIVLLKKLL